MGSRYCISINSEYKNITIGEETYPLMEVSRAEIETLRLSGKPGLVIKKNSRVFYAELPSSKMEDVRVRVNGGTHMCGACHRLSAVSDEEGGCAKVRAYSRGIENFKFIILGVETFNTQNDIFNVYKCTHWCPFVDKPKTLTPTQRAKVKLTIAQQVYPQA